MVAGRGFRSKNATPALKSPARGDKRYHTMGYKSCALISGCHAGLLGASGKVKSGRLFETVLLELNTRTKYVKVKKGFTV